MEKTEITDQEIFKALSEAGKLYNQYLEYQYYNDLDIYSSSEQNDFYRDMSYPIGLSIKD